MTDSTIELQRLSCGDADVSPRRTSHVHQAPALPRADGGWQAWSLLAGCFMVNVCIWGFAFSFGVLQDHYTTHEPFSSAPDGIAAIGTTTTGLMYLLFPFYVMTLQRWPALKPYSCWLSFILIAGGLIGASFANSVAQLIGTQGVLYALGGNMIVVPTITYLDEWFIQRKGLAMGIMWAGDGTGAVIMPLILQALLARYAFRVTLRVMAGLMILLMAPFMLFMKPRVPIARSSVARPVNMSFLRDSTFWILQIFNIAEATGYFLPPNYLPVFAQYLGYDAQLGALTLVVNGIMSVLGCIMVGILVDRVEVTSILFGLSLCAATSIFAIWGTSTSIGVLLVFAATYGLTAGAYSTAWTGMTKKLQTKIPGTDASIALSFLCAGRGIGSIISGPLSEALIDSATQLKSTASLAYGSGYGSLIIFSGCTAVAGGLSFVASQLELI